MGVLKGNSLKTLLIDLKDWFALKAKTVFSVNGTLPVNGNVSIKEVDLAINLSSDKTQQLEDEFVLRTSGGNASINDGDAFVLKILGNRVYNGYVAEVLNMSVIPIPREESPEITATIDRDTFVSYVAQSGTITLTYTTGWSADPANYGITVTNEPVAGDQIVVEYVKEDRGTIVTATPTALKSTGWNLYNHDLGYAKVSKYSEQHGFRIGGTYTSIGFASDPSGTPEAITPVNGIFTVPSDGYVIVTGGDAETTYIGNEWSDWDEWFTGEFEEYEESEVDISDVMSTYFPYGLLRVGDVRDEIDLNTSFAISRVERMAYNAENLALAKASGRDYEADTNYIYLVRAEESTNGITIDGSYTANDHGNEFFEGTTVAVYVEVLYGNNLKNKLERDVLTISAQELTAMQKAQVRSNIGAASDILGVIKQFWLTSTQKLLTVADDDTICPVGITIINLSTGDDSDLPSSSYKYGKAIVEKYATHRIVVTVRSVVAGTGVAVNRMGSSNTWGGWELYVSNYYPRNTQYAVVSEAYGYVTNATKTMFLDVTLPKALDRAPTITRLDLVVRGISGYVDVFTESKDVFAQSGFSVSCTLRHERLMRINVEKTTALSNVTNNTPIVAQVNNITFTA